MTERGEARALAEREIASLQARENLAFQTRNIGDALMYLRRWKKIVATFNEAADALEEWE